MKLDWLSGLSGDDVKERKEMVRSARPTLNVLKNILEKKKEIAYSRMWSQKSYDSPAWPAMQADILGELRTLNYVIELLDQEEK